MSNWELFFFLTFLAIQIVIPLFRYAKFLWRPNQSRIYGDYFWFFSWTMKLKATVGFVDIHVFDRDSGETILRSTPEDILPPKQYQFLYFFPSTSIQYVKYIEKKFNLQEKNYSLNIHIICSLNDAGPMEMVDDQVDMTKEKIKRLGFYDWYLGD
jgi:Vitamin K-dependent gamma-carboxylase, lumenal domain